jgi:integrase/recombinase XerD
MITWPDTDGAAIDCYMRRLHVRHPRTRELYRGELERFQRFVRSEGGLSHDAMRAWLVARSRQWPAHLVMDRACKINRFLDFLINEGTLGSHPLAELRARYGLRATAPVVRALLSPQPFIALEKAKRRPAFSSFLGPFLKEEIELRRSVGYRFHTQAERFGKFDRFLQSRPDLKGKDIAVLVREWEGTAKTLEQRWACHLTARNLLRAWGRMHPSTPQLSCDRRLKAQVMASRRRPHIFTQEQLRQILEAARTLPSPRAPLRARTLYTMVALAYCAGLRIGELVRLDLGDVCLADGTITVRDTKFFKSRRLPIGASAISTLREYLQERARHGARLLAGAPLFWRQTRGGGGRYTRMTTEILMERVLRRAGLKPSSGRLGPRFHDIRHSFVHHRMAEWYRSGINPESRLPYLATYLGHRDICSTLSYLDASPELLAFASDRFRSYVHTECSLYTGSRP